MDGRFCFGAVVNTFLFRFRCFSEFSKGENGSFPAVKVLKAMFIGFVAGMGFGSMRLYGFKPTFSPVIVIVDSSGGFFSEWSFRSGSPSKLPSKWRSPLLLIRISVSVV